MSAAPRKERIAIRSRISILGCHSARVYAEEVARGIMRVGTGSQGRSLVLAAIFRTYQPSADPVCAILWHRGASFSRSKPSRPGFRSS